MNGKEGLRTFFLVSASAIRRGDYHLACLILSRGWRQVDGETGRDGWRQQVDRPLCGPCAQMGKLHSVAGKALRKREEKRYLAGSADLPKLSVALSRSRGKGRGGGL